MLKTARSVLVVALAALICFAGGAGAGVYGSLTYGAKGGNALTPAPLPLSSDGLSVPVTGTITANTTGLATSTKQSDGTQKSQTVDGSGNVQPAGDVATRPMFVQLADGTNGLGANAAPLPVASPDRSTDSTFALSVWVQGAPVTTDSAPTNLASVSAGRIVRGSGKKGSVAIMGTGTVRVACIGGTSVAVIPWYYDNTLSVWVGLSAAVTVNAGQSTAFQAQAFYGAKIFIQITTVTGGVTAVGYDFL